MDPRFYTRNQIELPCPALDLPHPQRREARSKGQRQRQKQPALQDGPPISAVGIMFPFTWYMIHSDPAITISTITAVKR